MWPGVEWRAVGGFERFGGRINKTYGVWMGDDRTGKSNRTHSVLVGDGLVGNRVLFGPWLD